MVGCNEKLDGTWFWQYSLVMRIAFDFGLGPQVPGRRPVQPGEDTKLTQVMVMHRERSAENQTESAVVSGSQPEGIRIPGTDYILTSSSSAEDRDREVRAHEQSHLLNLGGAAASGIIYSFRRGVDGDSYASGGKIKADLSPVAGNPRATLSKAQLVIRAALAPASPSAADMRTAVQAYRLARDARKEMRSEDHLA